MSKYLPVTTVTPYFERGADAVFFEIDASREQGLHISAHPTRRAAFIVLETQADRAEFAARLRAAADMLSPAPKPKVKLPDCIDLCPVKEYADPEQNEYAEDDQAYNEALYDARRELIGQGYDVELIEVDTFETAHEYHEAMKVKPAEVTP